jgi:uncharacterized delta-60 repeat protein
MRHNVRRLYFLFGTCLIILSTIAAVQAAGFAILDPGFGDGGFVTGDFGGDDDAGRAIAVQADGKILVAGEANDDFLLVQYHADGTLDTGFGGASGYVATDFGQTQDAAHDLAIQADGKIVVVGTASGDFALARYGTDGALDTSFAEDGRTTTDFGDVADVAFAVVIQPDGKILAVGKANPAGTGNQKVALARYLPDGSLDSSFGEGGRVMFAYVADDDMGWSEANAVMLHPDGKIIVAGAWYWLEPLPGPPAMPGEAGLGAEAESPAAPLIQSDMAVAQLDSSGELDPQFSADGIARVDFFGRDDAALSGVLQPDGKIVVGGFALPQRRSRDFAVVRFNADGSLDPAFGTGGVVTADLSPALSVYDSNETPHALLLGVDGKITLVGDVSVVYNESDLALVRFTADGSLDPSFDEGDGMVVTDLTGGLDYGWAAGLQPDQRILVTGRSDDDLFVARYGVLEATHFPIARCE